MAKVAPAINNFTQGEVDPKLEGNTSWEGYFQALKRARNVYCSLRGNVVKRQGSKYLATTKYLDESVRLMPFEHSDNDTYMLEFGDYYIRFYTDGGVLETAEDSGIPYEIVSPYASADVPTLKFVNSADTTYIVHPSYPVQKLIRVAPTNWTISTVSFDPPPFRDENVDTTTMTPSATTGSISLTASAPEFVATMIGGHYMITGPDERAGALTASGTYAGTLILDNDEDLTYTVTGVWADTITLQSSYDQGTTWIDQISITANLAFQLTNTKDDVYWRIGFKDDGYASGTANVTIAKVGEYGYVQLTDFVSTTVVSGTVQRELPSTNTTTKWSESSWSPYRGYPEAVTFYEQRLMLGANTAEPQRLWGSQVDSYEDFEVGLGASDSYAYQLADTKVNKIRWLVPGEILYIGTLGSVWQFGSKTVPTSPTFVDAKVQTTDGCSNVQAMRAGNIVFYIQRGDSVLRIMFYDYQQENWPTYNISDKAAHLLEAGVKAIAYTSRPESLFWMVMEDGSLVTVTLQTNVNNTIFAFQKYTTQGCYDDVSVISGDDRDEVWVSIKRLVNGVPVYYIEQFQTAQWAEEISITIPDQVLPVIASPAAGTYYAVQWITLTCGTYGATIYYTLDGTDPTEESLVYTGPIYLDSSTTIKARGYSS